MPSATQAEHQNGSGRTASQANRHSLATRAVHGALALAIVAQLVTSYTMHRPRNGAPGDLVYSLHEYAGLLAFVLALLFWVTVLVRTKGTSIAALLPWFASARRRALWGDIAAHRKALFRLRLPLHGQDGPLASAIHGLGLTLVSVMALTGTYWFIMNQFGLGRAVYVHIFLELHALFGNLVWAYLIGHAGIALVHHAARTMSLGVMWSLRG